MWAGLSLRRLNPVWLGSVSCSRSSNRTGGVTASGSRKRCTVLRVTPSATSEHNLGWRDLWVNPHVLRRFLRPSLTEAPSLRRSYPASSVLRTSPPPHTARPVSRECQLILTAITAGASRVASGLPCLHAVAITPAGSMKLVRSSLSIACGLPCDKARSAPAIVFFEACSAFTRVTTCTLTESPSDPLHRRLRQLRCLCCRFDCYRVERTSSRAGVTPVEVQRLFTAHFITN
jgi:hypothetical protein